ncbi:MAG: hypothetical protein ACRDPI_04125 [Nocardioidaceae bacterium]
MVVRFGLATVPESSRVVPVETLVERLVAAARPGALRPITTANPSEPAAAPATRPVRSRRTLPTALSRLSG